MKRIEKIAGVKRVLRRGTMSLAEWQKQYLKRVAGPRSPEAAAKSLSALRKQEYHPSQVKRWRGGILRAHKEDQARKLKIKK